MAATESVFSDYEIRAMGVKVGDSEEFIAANCVGSVEEEAEVKQVTKNCRGMVAKKRTRGTGSGTLTISMHIPWNLYVKMFAMERDDLAEGVYAYGRDSVHPEMTITMDTFDEDGVEKFRAYPKCVVNTGTARKVENGGEEVAEAELEIGFMPDEDGNGVYDCMVSELGEDTGKLKDNWMTKWKPEMVKKGYSTLARAAKAAKPE